MKEVKSQGVETKKYCDNCENLLLTEEEQKARICNDCSAYYYAEHSNFRGIECIRRTEGVTNIVLNKKTEESIEKLIIELLKLTKEELIAFIIKNKISEGIKEYVAMRAEINVEKEEGK